MTPRQRETLARFDAARAEDEARQVARAKAMRVLHRETLPEFEPFFRELHALGMVAGWRSIRRIERCDGKPQRHEEQAQPREDKPQGEKQP